MQCSLNKKFLYDIIYKPMLYPQNWRKMKINEIPNCDKPYEKMQNLGEKHLSNSELLAIILRSGSKKHSVLELAHQILTIGGSGTTLATLNQYSLKDFENISGIGKIKAMQLKALLELSKRISKDNYPDKPLLNQPKIIADLYTQELRHLDHEELWLLSLDVKARLITKDIVFKGAISSCTISPREIFVTALSNKAARIILLHNHPSGNPNPSTDDISVTRQIYSLGEMLGMNLEDHIIIGDNKFISLREKRLF